MNIQEQKFNGKTYYLYENEKYFSKGCKRLHRVVWEFYNGAIPEGYHVHHVDGNTLNNNIDNLNLVHKSLHLRFEGKKRFKDNPDWAKDFHSKGIESAKEWHKSEAGRKWHSLHWKNSIGKLPLVKKICQVCDKEYETKHPNRSKYCHNNCKAKALRKRRKENK